MNILSIVGARPNFTDSGGVQEESTYLKVPCITLRNSTERPVTAELGTNHLMSWDNQPAIMDLADEILHGLCKKSEIPPLWDGNAAGRIKDILMDKFQ